MTRWAPEWHTAFPRVSGLWTLRSEDGWGTFDPESGEAREVDPAADERLPGLAAALQAGRLLGYRVGRRAVVATPTGFVKVVRPTRVDAIVERHALLADGSRPFSVPAVLNTTSDGRVELTTAAGDSLHQGIRSDPTRPLGDVGTLVAALHDQPAPDWLPARRPDDSDAWLAISRLAPTTHLAAIERAAIELPTLAPGAEVIVHGDLHDKNIYCDANAVDGAHRGAFIDLDGLSRGTAEEDIANLAVHLELRNLQGRTGLASGDRSRELYRTYRRVRPLGTVRLSAVERHTWFRLACLYQYRCNSRRLVPELLQASRERSPSEG